MKQSANPTVNDLTQHDVNLDNEETATVYMCEAPTGQNVLYINVDGINVLRLYSKQPIVVERWSGAVDSPLTRTKPARLK